MIYQFDIDIIYGQCLSLFVAIIHENQSNLHRNWMPDGGAPDSPMGCEDFS